MNKPPIKIEECENCGLYKSTVEGTNARCIKTPTGHAEHKFPTPMGVLEKEGCDKHNHPDCMKCFYTTSAELPEEKEEWEEDFRDICKKLNLREETTSGMDEQAAVKNLIVRILTTHNKQLVERIEEIISTLYKPDSLKQKYEIHEDRGFNEALNKVKKIIINLINNKKWYGNN